jgi:hypothetical protein
MTDAPRPRLRYHAAIFSSTAPDARPSSIIQASIEAIILNTPKGGCWRFMPEGVHHVSGVPSLGELPVSVVPVKPPSIPPSPVVDSGVVEPCTMTPRAPRKASK